MKPSKDKMIQLVKEGMAKFNIYKDGDVKRMKKAEDYYGGPLKYLYKRTNFTWLTMHDNISPTTEYFFYNETSERLRELHGGVFGEYEITNYRNKKINEELKKEGFDIEIKDLPKVTYKSLHMKFRKGFYIEIKAEETKEELESTILVATPKGKGERFLNKLLSIGKKREEPKRIKRTNWDFGIKYTLYCHQNTLPANVAELTEAEYNELMDLTETTYISKAKARNKELSKLQDLDTRMNDGVEKELGELRN